jgi:hypothetical protein
MIEGSVNRHKTTVTRKTPGLVSEQSISLTSESSVIEEKSTLMTDVYSKFNRS